MKHVTSRIVTTALLILLIIPGCKKDDPIIPVTNEYKAPKIATAELFSIPDEVEANENFSSMAGLISSFSGLFSNYHSFMAEIPDEAIHSTEKSTVDSWTWSNGGLSVIVTMTNAGTYNQWKLFINNALYCDDIEYIDVVKGESKLYDAGALKIDYKNEVLGTTANSTYLLMSDKTYFLKASSSTLTSAGYLDAYEGSNDGGAQFYHIQWTTTGSCSGWIKDLVTGKTFSF
jgi:hypothetical protein